MIGKVASMGIDLDPVKAEIDARTMSASNRYVDAAGLTTGLFGNSVTANVFVVGVAYQAGLIPLPADAIEQAIELNGAAVEANQTAFRWGRSWFVDPEAVERQADRTNRAADAKRFDVGTFDDPELQRLVEVSAADLVVYQNARYARATSRSCARPPTPSRRGRRGVTARSPLGRPPAPPADGVQGRVRGRPPAARRERAGRARCSATTPRRRGTCTRRRCGRWG